MKRSRMEVYNSSAGTGTSTETSTGTDLEVSDGVSDNCIPLYRDNLIEIDFKGIKWYCLVDTGAPVCMIDAELVKLMAGHLLRNMEDPYIDRVH